MVYLFVWHRLAWKCTNIYNACRTITLYDSLNSLFCDIFAAVVVCIRSLLLWSIKSHTVDLSVFCLLLEVIEKFQANKLCGTGKILYHSLVAPRRHRLGGTGGTGNEFGCFAQAVLQFAPRKIPSKYFFFLHFGLRLLWELGCYCLRPLRFVLVLLRQ